jgi:transposase-like protein
MQAVLESDEDLLAEVLRLGVQGLMEAERDAYVNAGVFERNAERKTHRNGYQDRQLRTRVGVLELKVPKTRDGAFYPSILERYQPLPAHRLPALPGSRTGAPESARRKTLISDPGRAVA